MSRMPRATRNRIAICLGLASLMLVGASPVLLHRGHRPRASAREPGARLSRVATNRQTIVAVGDSITKGDWDTNVSGGWVTRLGGKLSKAYPHMMFDVRNAGVDGDTTSGVLARLSRDVLSYQPSLVLISIGTNDFDDGVSPSSFEVDLRMVVGQLRATVNPPIVVLVSMLPIAGQVASRLVEQRRYNDIIRRTAATTGVGYLDLFDPWLALGPSYLRRLRHDTEHPNSIGYELLASTTAAFIEAGYLDQSGRVIAPTEPPTCDELVCGPAPSGL